MAWPISPRHDTRPDGPPDPFATALEQYWRTGHASYRYHRDDGWAGREDAWWYFTSYQEFPRFEKRALAYARGRVLDLGCGAGRHALYFQRKGIPVVGLERSPRVATIAAARGVHSVHVATVCEPLPIADQAFDAVVLFGNNLGLCGHPAATRRLLLEVHRVTRPGASLVCTSRAPDLANPRDLAYWQGQMAAGHELGELEITLEFKGERARVRLFLISPPVLLALGEQTGWEVTRIFTQTSPEEGYSAVLMRR